MKRLATKYQLVKCTLRSVTSIQSVVDTAFSNRSVTMSMAPLTFYRRIDNKCAFKTPVINHTHEGRPITITDSVDHVILVTWLYLTYWQSAMSGVLIFHVPSPQYKSTSMISNTLCHFHSGCTLWQTSVCPFLDISLPCVSLSISCSPFFNFSPQDLFKVIYIYKVELHSQAVTA